MARLPDLEDSPFKDGFVDVARQNDTKTFVDAIVFFSQRRFPEIDGEAIRFNLLMARLARRLENDLEGHGLRQFGFSTGSFRLSFLIFLAGSIEGAQLISIAEMSRANASGILKTLKRRGFIHKAASPRDARTSLLTLTELGRKHFLDAWRTVNERERAWADTLSAQERDTLIRLLEKIVQADPGRT